MSRTCGSKACSRGGLTADLSLQPYPNPTVGAGLLAKASVQSVSMLPDTPLSRASPLPQWIGVELEIRFDTEPCGSELARDGAGSACINANLYPLAPGAAISLVSK
ncbi:hypothetical protein B0E42_19365 [Pseudomonas sp. A25(2017)]|nr:hypothetical protein B0E42_19365 [Pseudomonas sp. A25(2017)]